MTGPTPPDLDLKVPARLEPASALRKTIRDGYGLPQFRADALAGVVVGVVALPLSMALAIAVGVPPQYGLYTAIVAGVVVALLGGSRVQVTGPTAAFVVVLAPVTAQHGLGGLALATALAGLLLMAMGWARLGRLIEFVPYPVTTGFTAGIGVVIATLQVRDLLGLDVAEMPESYVAKVAALARALPTWSLDEVAIGALTVTLLLVWPRLSLRMPAPLVALSIAAAAAWIASRLLPGFEVATIASRFQYEVGGALLPGIPRAPPLPVLPWQLPGADGAPVGLSFELLRELLPPAFAIAMLGAIESLLSAVVADGMIRRQHDPDAELFGQGMGNLVAPFFGGFAATGAIARTATNVRSGGRSPIAAVIHSVFLLLAVLVLAPALGLLPMASLAALLLVVAWRMSEARHVVHTVRTAPRSDVVVLLVCLTLTVLFDMVVAVSVGVVLAALLFMRQMAGVSKVELVAEPHRRLGFVLPPSVVLYEVAGPLFFGAAARAMRALESVDHGIRAVVLDLRSVPALDATGLVSLESAIERLRHRGIFVALAGVERQPLRALIKAGWRGRSGVILRQSFEKAVAEAIERAEGNPEATGTTSAGEPDSPST
ncbi:MAG TPA: C4-dicarboxylic acid transporter DauA [Thermoanaerobaculia bacterium]|nr:C4-dicarboxylic acid transporter DauA [Thermoanaerobaculia bacterium]